MQRKTIITIVFFLVILMFNIACSTAAPLPEKNSTADLTHKTIPFDRWFETTSTTPIWYKENLEFYHFELSKPKKTSKVKVVVPKSRITYYKPANLPEIKLRGKAKYYATGRNGMYAAAGPPLRKALGPKWRGKRIYVCYDNKCIRVTLNDYCGCNTTEISAIDLSDEAFAALAPKSRGELRASFRW